MSYHVLARKWRPGNFSELVGQEHVVAAISNALDNNRLHHAYLFTGTRGVGKTTIARIFSKSLNCEQGMSSTPCGKCGTCLEIESGNFVDLLEIDAASRTKVEDTRELLDNVQYKPTRGEYKVYLIDEVHMLSKHSFNALLKTLEEPPPHVKFLLATTDPQKLPITILSRCLQFNLKALSRTQISEQLSHILGKEDIPFEDGAVAQLARAAQGSMRDALSLTDQAIAQGNGQVGTQVVTDMLGLMDKGQILKLVHAVLNKESAMVMEQVESLSYQAPDYTQVISEIMSLLHQVALTQFVPEACKLETVSARAIYQLAKSVSAEQVQLLYQIALQGKKDLPYAADGRTGLEMTLLRMLAFSPSGLSLSLDEMQNLELEAPASQAKPVQQPVESAQVEAPHEAVTPPVQEQVQAPVQEVTPEPSQDKASVEVAHQAPVPVEALSTSEVASVQPQKQIQEPTQELTQEQPVAPAADAFDQQMMAQLEQQQQQIVEQAESFHPQQFEQQPAPEVTQPVEQPQETQGPSTLSATESLLALKQKVQESASANKEQEPPVKKSDSADTVVPAEAEPAGTPEPQLSALTQVSEQISDKAPEKEPVQTTSAPLEVENDLSLEADEPYATPQLQEAQTIEPPVSIEQSNESQTTVSEPKPVPEPTPEPEPVTEVKAAPVFQRPQPVAPEPEKEPAMVLNQMPGDLPPWIEDGAGDYVPPQAPERFEVIDPIEDFDPNAHLEEEVNVEVDFDVPVFLDGGEKVINASQLDTWSNLIEQMPITALTKQLALHSSYQKVDDKIILTLLEEKEHLISELAVSQLTEALSSALQQQVTLEIQLKQPINTPFAVQQTINRARHAHAHHVVETDETMVNLKNTFAASVVDGSVKAR